MSREVKRVALDFKWHQRTDWPGYQHPLLEHSHCPVCDGEDEECEYGKWSDEYYICIHPTLYDAVTSWERIDPPPGDGFQLWQTVSEGSPVSPVCKTLDELTAWMERNNYSKWAVQWVSDGKTWLPSGMGFSNQLSFVQDYDSN
jgi:hypothetical protein